MDLNEIAIFARVVQAGSFTAAARALSMPKSTVSRKVLELEERLGSRLLQRTTRKLSLTDVGRAYYEHAARVVSEVEEAERAVGELAQVPRGLLRVTAPLNFEFLGPIVTSFLAQHAEVQLELVCTDRVVDLIEERFDVGIRAGPLADSTLIARGLGSMRPLLVASRKYLRKRGRPRAPEELAVHDCIVFGTGSARASYRLTNGARTVEIAARARLTVNDLDVLHEAVSSGLGVALLPIFRCLTELRSRRLERVLEGWEAPVTPIHAVYPSLRHLSPKVKSFVDHLQEQLSPPPWELGPAP